MDLGSCCAVLFVANIEASKKFYISLLGFDVEYDFGKNVAFKQGFAIWEFGSDHIIARRLGVGTSKDRNVSRFELYFEVDKLEVAYKHLKEENVRFLHELHEEPWGQKTMRFFDPDNHLVEVGEKLAAFIRRLYREGLSVDEIAIKSGVSMDDIRRFIEP